MKISLLTDAPRHNLALMKISAYHKAVEDEIKLNMPLWKADKRYASILFDWNCNKFIADEYGGPGYNFESLESKLNLKPDYDLYNLDFSLGYTYRFCPRKCPFCIVPRMEKDKMHYSIWDFHLSKFKRICLLNNNTFADPKWKETFEEIWDADLTIIDENGYDLRLMDEEKAETLKKTKFQNEYLHFAWDQIEDEQVINQGLEFLKRLKIINHNTIFYILIGFNSTEDEDIHRCQKIIDYGGSVYPMPFKRTTYEMMFKRFINLHYYRKYASIESAWRAYKKHYGHSSQPILVE